MSLNIQPKASNTPPPDSASGHWPLLSAEDPPPFEVVNPGGSAPFLLVCDHASRLIPPSLDNLGVADWVLDRHVACDIGAKALTLALSRRFNAVAVLAGYSRLVVDLNRQLHDPSAFIKVSDGIAIPGNIELQDAQRQARIDTFFDPYHAAVKASLDMLGERGHTPAMISVHTCTPVYNRIVRRWHIGIMWDADARIAKPLLANLDRVPELCVGDNEPYSGAHPSDYTIDQHAERHGLPCVGIEVRQDLVDNQEGAEHWAQILGDGLAPIMADDMLYTRRKD